MSKKNEPGMAYDMQKLNKVFAFLSVIFLLTVIWVFLDDYMRPWKAVQLEARQIKREKLAKSIESFENELDQEKLKEIEEQIEEAQIKVNGREEKIREVQAKLSKVEKNLKSETLLNGTLSAEVSELQFNYGKAFAKKKRSQDALFEELTKTKTQFAESSDRMRALNTEKDRITDKIAELRQEVTDAEKAKSDLYLKKELLIASKKQTDIDPIFALRNAPFIDFLDPTLKVEQVVLDDITDDRYFQKVAKVDRCMTCHTLIDVAGYEDQDNPHKTHPNLDLMVGLKSDHPMKDFGCTTCHQGEGHRVNNFVSAAHSPQNEKQKKEWKEKYGWKEHHYIDKPMLPLQHTEASCLKCHGGVEFIPEATALNEGRQKIEEYGCYACHKIEGWEHKRTPGPSLEKVASKISKDFFKSWVWDPKAFNKHAKMPSFFMQDNNDNPEYMKKNITEVNAMAEYIWDKSKDYSPFMSYRTGDKERGKKLIKEVGCLSCHGVEGLEAESKKVNSIAGPYLTGTGSKVEADWLVSWLKKPSHYQEDTIMPSFRLSDREAQDITAYLMGLKNKAFESLDFAPLDGELRDEILVTYFSAFDPVSLAEKRLEKMTAREKTLELGQRSVAKYGCYSCHSIEGFDDYSPIGPELTNEGSKPLTQFGFNLQKEVEHTRHGWIKAHLINPARWDEGMDKPFKDITKMPNFGLTDKEAEVITTAILGQVDEYVPLAGVKQLSANEKKANAGMQLLNKFQCIACHQVDGKHGNLLEIYDDVNNGPPRLVDQGHRMQADWFHHFLGNVSPIRPWLNVRMPSYNLTNEEKNTIAHGFLAMSDQEIFESQDKVEWEPGERKAATQLFESYACASCHTAGFNNDEASAPSLYKSKRRLRASWIKKWLLDPQAILPGTLMPNFWFDGESLDPDILEGDADKQIDALTKYIMEIGYDELPKGQSK